MDAKPDLGDDRRGLRQNTEHVEIAVLNHQLKRPAEQEVADEHAGFITPDRIGAGGAAAQIALVYHVVMEQRRGVNELDAAGETDMAVALVAAHAGRG